MDRGQYITSKAEALYLRAKQAYTKLVNILLSELEPSMEDGHLVFTPALLARLNRVWDKWVKTVHQPALAVINEELDNIHDMVLDDYRQEFDVSPSTRALSLIKGLGFATFATNTLANELSRATRVKTVLASKIVQVTMARGTIRDFTGMITILVPSEFDRYFRTHLYDMYSQYERVAAGAYAEDLGLEHAIYAGTVIETTREFCEHRVNKAYSIDEIKAWNNIEWRGKIPGVDVLIALGGYNCRHYLNYITESTYNRLKEQEE